MNTEQARFNMIEQQIRPWNVSDSNVLDLLFSVKREQFVPESLRGLAFADLEIPLGKKAGQAMLAPKVEARLLQDLALQHSDKVLQVGTGSGYVTALLAQQSAEVKAYEMDSALAEKASENLQAEGIENAQVCAKNALLDIADNARFDAIVLCGSVASVPSELLAQLRPGGRLWAVVGEDPIMEATLIQTTAKGPVSRSLWETVLPRLHGFPEHARFQF